MTGRQVNHYFIHIANISRSKVNQAVKERPAVGNCLKLKIGSLNKLPITLLTTNH